MVVLILTCVKITGRMAHIADPDQTAPKEQSDQGLHCLPKHICSNTYILVERLSV